MQRFYCHHPGCPRRTFAERFPYLPGRHAQRTRRLAEAHARTGLALSGQPIARLLSHLAMLASATTLLWTIRQLPFPTPTDEESRAGTARDLADPFIMSDPSSSVSPADLTAQSKTGARRSLWAPTDELRSKALEVHRRLGAEFGLPIPYFHNLDPLSELVSSLLSNRTRNAGSGRAFKALRRC